MPHARGSLQTLCLQTLRLPTLCRPALWLLLAVMGYSGALEWAASHGPAGAVEANVSAYLDRSETTAVEAFAVARAINAAVSLLKSADLSAVVAQIAPLQVLEPVDDLAKQFSDVMVVSIVAIQMQRLLLLVSRAWAFAFLLPVGCLLLAAACVLPARRQWGARLARLGRMVIVAAVFARCIVLLAGLVGQGLTQEFLARDLNSTMTLLRESGTHLTQITAAAAPPASQASAPVATPPARSLPSSVLDRMASSVRDALQSAREKTVAAMGHGESMVNSAESWVPDPVAINAFLAQVPDRIVRAIEIFLVQTLLTPLIVALALYGALRAVMRPA
jgi:hypothetical protein